MATETNAATSRHTVVTTALGELTLVREADALRGQYYPHHRYVPSPATFGPRSDDGFDDAVEQLGEYLAGQRHEFDLAVALYGSEFEQRVWHLVRQVPYGDTVTYGEQAGRLGRDVTAQQVGAAVARNPLCVVAPGHRVVGAGGRLTGYAGGAVGRRVGRSHEPGVVGVYSS